jgi:hypothetical protein
MNCTGLWYRNWVFVRIYRKQSKDVYGDDLDFERAISKIRKHDENNSEIIYTHQLIGL